MKAFELAIDLNLRTVLVTTEAAIPEMRARGGGSLLFTASTSGLQGSAYSPVYSMCKFGVVGFVKSLAVRLAPEKIRVNAVCPGPIDTPMLRVFVARPDQKSTAGMDPEELVRRRAARLGAAGPHRPARGDRQCRALPAVRRGVVRHRRRAAGRRRGDRRLILSLAQQLSQVLGRRRLVVLLELHVRLRAVELPLDVGLRVGRPREENESQRGRRADHVAAPARRAERGQASHRERADPAGACVNGILVNLARSTSMTRVTLPGYRHGNSLPVYFRAVTSFVA